MKKFWTPLRQRAQSELLKRGRCVADAKSLAEGKRKSYQNDEKLELVICECRRVYIYNKQLNSYRRASLGEI